jgi:predicted metal-dependent peptidase
MSAVPSVAEDIAHAAAATDRAAAATDASMSAAHASSDAQIRRRLTASQMRLMDRHPFFGALLLMAPVVVTDEFPTAATDGARLFFNPHFVAPLTSAQLDGLVVHELLHCALLHRQRRGARDPFLWNVAADIHINGMVRQLAHLDLPDGAVEDTKLAQRSVEEIYAVLLKRRKTLRLAVRDLDGPDAAGLPGEAPAEAAARLAAQWTDAMHRARAVEAMQGHGKLPAGVARLVDDAIAPQVDWRTTLWRHLVRTPDDFQGFDRRHLWNGLYLESLEGESVDLDVCVDTSGSVDDRQLREFLAEVRGILRSYPSVRCRLYFADAAVVGPFELDGDRPLPVAAGGGGTDFRPFFLAVDPGSSPGCGAGRARHADATRLAVYLTDGWGTFPEAPPDCQVLWVVVPGGLETAKFPFGEVVRMTYASLQEAA